MLVYKCTPLHLRWKPEACSVITTGEGGWQSSSSPEVTPSDGSGKNAPAPQLPAQFRSRPLASGATLWRGWWRAFSRRHGGFSELLARRGCPCRGRSLWVCYPGRGDPGICRPWAGPRFRLGAGGAGAAGGGEVPAPSRALSLKQGLGPGRPRPRPLGAGRPAAVLISHPLSGAQGQLLAPLGPRVPSPRTYFITRLKNSATAYGLLLFLVLDFWGGVQSRSRLTDMARLSLQREAGWALWLSPGLSNHPSGFHAWLLPLVLSPSALKRQRKAIRFQKIRKQMEAPGSPPRTLTWEAMEQIR